MYEKIVSKCLMNMWIKMMLKVVIKLGLCVSFVSAFSIRKATFEDHCRPLDKLSFRIDALVYLPKSGTLYAFNGNSVSRLSDSSSLSSPVSEGLYRFQVDDGFPKPISKVWPQLNGVKVRAAFRLNDQIHFLQVCDNARTVSAKVKLIFFLLAHIDNGICYCHLQIILRGCFDLLL